MWMCAFIFWIFMVGGMFLVGLAEHCDHKDVKYLVAAFSGPFAEHVTGLFLPASDGVVNRFDFLLLSMLVGSSICFFTWRTRYAELCAGAFFILSMFVWFAESIVWLIWE